MVLAIILLLALACHAQEEPDTTPVTMSPDACEWGSYYKDKETEMSELFAETFAQFQEAEPDASKCDRVGPTGAQYSRYYRNIRPGQSNLLILSYFCMAGNSRERGYEHIKVDEDSRQFLQFQDALSEFGIEAGDYSEDKSMSGDAARQFMLSMFGDLEDQIPGEQCANASLNTVFKMQHKEENGLDYWRFPIACTERTPDDTAMDVEIFQDPTQYINGGKFTFVGFDGKYGNQYYWELQKLEGDKDASEPQSDLQSAATAQLARTALAIPALLIATLFA